MTPNDDGRRDAPPNRRFAITYTVKNEATLLPDAIAYHQRLGCQRFYVFFDGTTDDTRNVVRNLDTVCCQESVDPTELGQAPSWIKSIIPRWRDSMDVRKRINTYVAAELARREGIEWIINIDPDELLLLDDREPSAPEDSDRFFAGIAQEIDQILLPNLEAVPIGAGTGRPFVDCTLFLTRFPLTEFLWRGTSALIRRTIPSPKVHAWYDHLFFRVRFAGMLPRLMRHPVTCEKIPAGYFLGYSNHKAFVRTPAAADLAFNIHRWEAAAKRPKSVKSGHVLHYDLCSAEYFCAKYRQRQPAMLVKAFFCRYMFAQIARDLPFETARDFFLTNICITRADTLARLRRWGVLREISSIAEFMQGHASR